MCVTDPFFYPQVKNNYKTPLGICVYSWDRHHRKHPFHCMAVCFKETQTFYHIFEGVGGILKINNFEGQATLIIAPAEC